MDDKPTLEEISKALETLTKAIGCYGDRINQPFAISWGNGVTAHLSGQFVAGGLPMVAKRILEKCSDEET